MKRRYFSPLVLLFVVAGLFVSCPNVTQSSSNVSLSVDAQALCSLAYTRSADEAPLKVTISLYVDGKLFSSQQKEITKDTSDFILSFPGVPVGSMVKASALLEWDGKSTTAYTDSVEVMETGTELEFTIEWTDDGNSGGGGSGESDDPSTGKKVTNSFEVTTPQNIKIKITASVDENLYLNKGKISLSAQEVDSSDPVAITGAQLFYGDNQVPASYYTYNDGVFSIGKTVNGTTNKLLAPGDYQLYVTTGQSDPATASSCMIPFQVQEKEYYEYSLDGVGENNLSEFCSQIRDDLSTLVADTLVLIKGNPEIAEGDTYAKGVIGEISDAISDSGNYYVDLDMSGTGPNLSTLGATYNDSFNIDNDYVRSIILSSNVKSICEESFRGDLRGLKVIRFAGTNDDLVIEGGAFKNAHALELFEIEGDSESVHTAANGTVLLVPDSTKAHSKILATTSKFTNLDLSDDELFPGATNPDSANYITEIASYAFYERDLVITSLGAITSADAIDDNAFNNVSIQNLSLDFIPNELSFNDTEISNLTVDFDVTTENCSNFKAFIGKLSRGSFDSVTFNKDVYLPDNDKVFGNQTSLKNLTFKGNTIIGKSQFEGFDIWTLVCSGPTQIGDKAFYCSPREYYDGTQYNGVSSMDLSGVTSLGDRAIYADENFITNGVLTYPPLIQSMHPNSFCLMIYNSLSDKQQYESRALRNQITSFSIDEDNEYYSVVLDGKAVVDKTSKELFIVAKNDLTSVDFADTGIEIIPDVIPDVKDEYGSVKESNKGYDLSNFANSPNLASVTLSGVKTVADDAFVKCPNLKTVTIPSGVESISARAFVVKAKHGDYSETNDTKIETINCTSNSKYKVVTVSDENKMLVEDTTKTLIFMAQLASGTFDFSTYSNDIETIAPYACSHQSALTEVNFTGIKDIQNDAFVDCRNLLTFNWGSVETIGKEAFAWTSIVYQSGDTKPKITMEFPSSLKMVEYAFGNRDGDTTLENGQCVSSIKINGSNGSDAHPLALQEGAFASYYLDSNNADGIPITLPTSGTWYYIWVNSDYDQATLKQYVSDWVNDPTQFPGVISNNTEWEGIKISEDHINYNDSQDGGVKYKLDYSAAYGWLYFKPANN